jgi:hypothetical protein
LKEPTRGIIESEESTSGEAELQLKLSTRTEIHSVERNEFDTNMVFNTPVAGTKSLTSESIANRKLPPQEKCLWGQFCV